MVSGLASEARSSGFNPLSVSVKRQTDNTTPGVKNTRVFKGLISPPYEPPGEIMSFGVSPVNCSDSDSWGWGLTGGD